MSPVPGNGRTACQLCVQMWSKVGLAPPALWGGDRAPGQQMAGDSRWPLLELMLTLEFTP